MRKPCGVWMPSCLEWVSCRPQFFLLLPVPPRSVCHPSFSHFLFLTPSTTSPTSLYPLSMSLCLPQFSISSRTWPSSSILVPSLAYTSPIPVLLIYTTPLVFSSIPSLSGSFIFLLLCCTSSVIRHPIFPPLLFPPYLSFPSLLNFSLLSSCARYPALWHQDSNCRKPRVDLWPGVYGWPDQTGLLLLSLCLQAKARELWERPVAAHQLHLPAGLWGHGAGLQDLRLPLVSNPYPCTVHKSEHLVQVLENYLAEVSFSRDIYCHLFFYLALSAAISKSGNNIIIEESSKTFFFFSLICTDGLPCYRRIGVSVWSACLLLLRKRDPLDVVVFFPLCVQ